MSSHIYFTVAEVRDQLRLSKPDGILAAIHRGELKAVNVSGGPSRPTWRISQSALSEWLASRTVRPSAATVRRRARRVAGSVTRYF